jgi:nucleotide-binding universal stress UspA family protein
MMKTILVPTDFSAVANNAMQYAMGLAKVAGKKIKLFHAGFNDRQKSTARLKELADAISLKNPSATIEFEVSDEVFDASSLGRLVKSEDITLIIMGTVGEGAGLSKKLLGRNSMAVLEEVNCPVLVVPPGFAFKGITSIGYASDLGDFELETARVISFAKLFNAAIRVAHISPVFPDLADAETMDMTQKMEEVKQKHNYASISYYVEDMPLDNQVDKGIELFLKDNPMDLLVMFHNKRSAFDQLFSSSHTGHTVSHLEIPLLVFPKA